MTTIERTDAPAQRDDNIPLLPERPHRAGPVTRRLLLRTASVLALVEIAAAVLLLVGGRTAAIVGTSLIIPGGGLLYGGHPVLFALTAAAVVLAIVMWWGISMAWGIPAVWAASGVAAVVIDRSPRVLVDDGTTWGWAIAFDYAVAAACLVAIVGSFERRFRTKRAHISELNDYLSTVELPEPSKPEREPDDMDAELLRWCHELALQPLDGFAGFEWGDQYHGGTCVRYQLNSLAWALSAYAVNYVPNAPQPMEQVLRNLMLKQTDLRVWGYWRKLNLIGNFDANPDPLVRDNIMFSGFSGDQLNLYKAVTGSDHFDQPGSLTFVWKDGRTFSYDHHSWMEAVQRNFTESRLGFFPCEPGWAFAACNAIGAQALVGYDALHGTTMWADFEDRWRQTLLDEYLMPDGNYANIRCIRTGLSWDTGETPGGEYLVTGSNQFVDIAPDLARRGQALAVRNVPEKMAALSALVDDDGHLDLELPTEWERNRARETALNAWTKVIAGARMVGDERLATAAGSAADRQCATGERWPERPVAAGVQNMGIHLIARWSTPLTNGDINLRGYEPPTGPLVDAPWPDVMITKARSADGRSLDAAFRPIERSAGDDVTVTFDQLDANATYEMTVDGGGPQTVTAGAEGTASATVTLASGATRLHLSPQESDR